MTEIERLHLGRFDRHGTTRARHNGQLLEVEHGIPGEVVRAEIHGGRRPRGRIVEVLEPAPDRVEAPCVYFRDWQCGGCQWQMVAYDGQLLRKREMVDAAMRAANLPLAVGEVHSLREPWRYRSTAGISLGKRAGFRRHGSLAIVPIHDCPISHHLIGRLMAHLNDGLESGTLPDFRGRVRLEVRLTGEEAVAALLVHVRFSDEDRSPAEGDLAALFAALEAFPDIHGISRQEGEEVVPVRGELFGTTLVAGKPVSLAASSFFQTNLRLLPRLIDRIRQEAQPVTGRRVADVYGGVGIFGLFLAAEAGEVEVIETDPLAARAGERTAEAWGVSNIRFLPQSAEEALAGEAQYDIVIVDPPRAGLTGEVVEALRRMRPQTVLYVSCLAESLARDLNDFGDAFGVESLELFDFYPQTYHVELLAVLRARG